MRNLVAMLVLVGASGCASSAALPRKAIELNQLGVAALARGELEVAEARIATALEYNGKFVEAWVNLGLIDEARGDFKRARRDFVKARDINPDIPITHHALGQLDEREGAMEEAEHNYRAALKVDPGFAPARLNLGRRLFERGAYDDAREQFLRLTQVAPNVAAGWTSLCETLLKLHRYEDADDVLVTASKRFPDDPNIQLLEGRALMRARRLSEAVATFQPLTERDDPPRAGAAWAWMALARMGMGEGSEALRAAEQAVALLPGDPLAMSVLKSVREGLARASAETTQPAPAIQR